MPLVEHGSRLDMKGQTPDTALSIAIREKHIAVVRWRSKLGAFITNWRSA
jgi:hypothetical protein